jgi:hypothetical protein
MSQHTNSTPAFSAQRTQHSPALLPGINTKAWCSAKTQHLPHQQEQYKPSNNTGISNSTT